MIFKKNITFIFLFFLSIVLPAQNYVDLLKIYYANTPQNNFDNINGATNIEEFGADILLPLKINDSNVVLTGAFLEQINTNIHPLTNPITISTINLKVGFNHLYNKKWSGTYMLLPKLSSDFKSNSSKNLQLGGLIIMKLKKREQLYYSFGAYYNNELFGPFLVPLLGMYYQSNNQKLEINATLPIWADINFKLFNSLKVGTSFSAFVRSYYLSENKSYLVKKTNELFGYLQFEATKGIIIQTKVGYSIGRSFEAYKEDEKVSFGLSAFRFGDDRTTLNPTFSDGLIFQVRLIYRYHH